MTAMLTDEERSKLVELEKAATPGPWERQPMSEEEPGSSFIVGSNLQGLVGGAHAWPTELDSGDFSRVEANAALIAAARNALPALLAADAAVRGMREAWQPISTAPQGEDVLIAVFRDDFEDPIIQNSILIDGEERGLYWSDWHGMPEPTHWMRYSRPGSTPAAPAITQAELVELLALMDAVDSALDKDTYDQSLRDEFDAPDDADYSVCAGTVRKCSAVFAAIEKLRNRMSKP